MLTLTRVVVLVAAAALVGVVASLALASGRSDVTAISSGTLPTGYRDWKLISVAHEAGDLNDLRAVLGNDVAIKAYREGKNVFPDGAIIARLAWRYLASEENDKAFGRPQSFVAGPPANGVQFMVKDSRRYASTGGWAFAHFDAGKPANPAVLATCLPCHQAVSDRDLVFTRYSP
jgi:Cytochrome P460